MMSKLFEQVLAEVAKLPEAEQEALASRWLSELRDDREWDSRFQGSPEKLERLADEALAELDAGLTQHLEPNRL